MNIEPRFEDGEVLFALRLDFEPGSEDPARVFKAMSELIEVFQALDSDLSRGVSVAIRPVYILHDVEQGSIVAWLRTVLEQANDDALLHLDWRPMVGQYLVRAKHAILEWLRGREGISSVDELEPLEQELLELAEETAVLRFPSYAEVPRASFLEDLKGLSDALRWLQGADTVTYVSPAGQAEIDRSFHITAEEIEDLLTAEVQSGEYELVMLVKKPDYLGASMWEFRLDGHTLHGRMLDEDWLERFRARDVVISPGDALRARVRVEVKRAADGSTVAARYHVLKVHEVVPFTEGPALELFERSHTDEQAEALRLPPGDSTPDSPTSDDDA